MKGTVTNVELVETYEDLTALCKLRVGLGDYYVFGDKSILMNLLSSEIEFTTRTEVINGIKSPVINSCINISNINCAKVDTNSGTAEYTQLIRNSSSRLGLTPGLSDLKVNEALINCTGFVVDAEYKESTKANWMDLSIIDGDNNKIVAKLFDIGKDKIEEVKSMIGGVIAFDIKKTKYGFDLDNVYLHSDGISVPPEVDIAAQEVKLTIDSDAELKSFCDGYKVLNSLYSNISIDVGYELVYMATELRLLRTISTVVPNLNLKSLCRAVICSRGNSFMKTKYSNGVANVILCGRTSLGGDSTLLSILDIPKYMERVDDINVEVYYFIKLLAKYLVERVGKNNETFYSEVFNDDGSYFRDVLFKLMLK